jgi:hypothetical protein
VVCSGEEHIVRLVEELQARSDVTIVRLKNRFVFPTYVLLRRFSELGRVADETRFVECAGQQAFEVCMVLIHHHLAIQLTPECDAMADLNLNLVLPSGYVAELQVHLAAIADFEAREHSHDRECQSRCRCLIHIPLVRTSVCGFISPERQLQSMLTGMT